MSSWKLLDPTSYVEDLKSGNIQVTNEVLSLLFRVQCFNTLPHQPSEQMIDHAFGHGAHRVRVIQFCKIYYFQILLTIHPFVEKLINVY
jgi:hypothetical protein